MKKTAKFFMALGCMTLASGLVLPTLGNVAYADPDPAYDYTTTVEQAQIAKRQGADYLGVGAVFSTDTKKDAKHVPLQVLKEICEAVNLPVVAIGGIDEDNVDELTGSGICGVAVVSAILASDDIMQAAKNLKRDWVL